MKINKYDNYVVLADDRGGFSDFVPFLIKQVETNFKGEKDKIFAELIRFSSKPA